MTTLHPCFALHAQFPRRMSRLLSELATFQIGHAIYGFCDNLKNIENFGLRMRRGKQYSTLPQGLHEDMVEQGLNWGRNLPLEYGWYSDKDFLWSDQTVWDHHAELFQVEIHQIWAKHGLATGVSLPLRRVLDKNCNIGSTLLLFANRGISAQNFTELYHEYKNLWRCRAESFSDDILRNCFHEFYPLTRREIETLQLYRLIGDAPRIALHKNVSSRAVQLCLQRARLKLEVDSNTEAVNLCQTFGLFSEECV